MKITNASDRQYQLNVTTKAGLFTHSIPPRSKTEAGGFENGSVDIPDDHAQALLAKDGWLQSVIDSGDLIVGPVDPVVPAEPVSAEPKHATSDHGKHSHKR
jgi:hypothetical protein